MVLLRLLVLTLQVAMLLLLPVLRTVDPRNSVAVQMVALLPQAPTIRDAQLALTNLSVVVQTMKLRLTVQWVKVVV